VAVSQSDFVELVADIEDAAAFGGQPPERLEQDQDRLRRQHRRGLVHDQKLGLLKQATHDLDALPLAHRHAVNEAVGIDRKSVFFGHLGDLGRQFRGRNRLIQRQRDVLPDGQRLEQ